MIEKFIKILESGLGLLRTGFCGISLLLLALFNNNLDNKYDNKFLYNKQLYTNKLEATSNF